MGTFLLSAALLGCCIAGSAGTDCSGGCTVRISGITCTFEDGTTATTDCVSTGSQEKNAGAGFVFDENGNFVFVEDQTARTTVTTATISTTTRITTNTTTTTTATTLTTATATGDNSKSQRITLTATFNGSISDLNKTLTKDNALQAFLDAANKAANVAISAENVSLVSFAAARRSRRTATDFQVIIVLKPEVKIISVDAQELKIMAVTNGGQTYEVIAVGSAVGFTLTAPTQTTGTTTTTTKTTMTKTTPTAAPPPPSNPCDKVSIKPPCECDRDTAKFVVVNGAVEAVFTVSGAGCNFNVVEDDIADNSEANKTAIVTETDVGECFGACCAAKNTTSSPVLTAKVQNCVQFPNTKNCEGKATLCVGPRNVTIDITPVDDDCDDNTTIIIIVVIFGVLLCFVLAVAIYFCMSKEDEPVNLSTSNSPY